MKILSALVLSLLTGLAGLAGIPLIASASGDHAGSHAGSSPFKPPAITSAEKTDAESSTSKSSNAAITEGEIKKVDKGAGKITIKHAELKNLDMPAMTMVFQVKDKAMLEQVKAGDKVKFVANKVGGKLIVTQMGTPQ